MCNVFILLYVRCIKTTCFGLFRPSSGFSYSLESEVSYRQITSYRCFDCQLYTIHIKFVKHNGDVTLKKKCMTERKI